MYRILFILVALYSNFGRKINTETVHVSLKSSITLTCPVREDQFPQWYKTDSAGNEIEIFFEPDKYDFQDISELIIKNIGFEDAGMYYCKIAFTDNIKKKIEIKISNKKDISSSTSVSQTNMRKPEWKSIPYPNVTAESSQFIVLLCKAFGDGVTVSVYKLHKDGSIEKKLRESQVVIHQPSQSDAGKYKCVAENKAGKIEHEFNLFVKQDGSWSSWSKWTKCDSICGYGMQERYRECNNPPPSGGGRRCYGREREQQNCRERSCQFPRMTKFGFEITENALILSCKGKGIPEPIAEWSFAGRRLGRASNITGELKIPKSLSQAGFYRCKLSNQAGYFSVSIEITEV